MNAPRWVWFLTYYAVKCQIWGAKRFQDWLVDMRVAQHFREQSK